MIAPLALALLQDAPKPRTPDAAVYDALIKKTNELKAFVAEYRVKTSEAKEELTLRIAYRAPGEMRVELPGKFLFLLRDGVIEASTSGSEGHDVTARVPIGELSHERRVRLTDAVRSEFTSLTTDWKPEPDCGVKLEFLISPNKTDEKEDFQFQAGYTCSPTPLLRWLDYWKWQEDVHYDGDDHLEYTTARGTTLRLSARTGFIERAEKDSHGIQKRLELTKLDLAPEFDGKAFEMPPPAEGTQDTTVSYCCQMHQLITQGHRIEFFQWVSNHVSDKSLSWDAEARIHVRKVFERIHTDGIGGENALLLAGMKDYIEKFGTVVSAEFSKLGGQDTAARGELEAKIESQRKELVDNLRKRLDSRTASDLSLSRRTVPDDALRDDLKHIEQEADETAFAHVIQDPLLEAFDDAVSKAKGGG